MATVRTRVVIFIQVDSAVPTLKQLLGIRRNGERQVSTLNMEHH